MDKNVKKVLPIIFTIVLLICIYIGNYILNNKADNITNNTAALEKKSTPIQNVSNSNQDEYYKIPVNYSINKLDFYSNISLDKLKGEYVYINSANDRYIVFSIEQFYKQNELGRSKTSKIGLYDIKSNTVSYIKKFDDICFVQDIAINSQNQIAYVYYNESNHWFVRSVINKEDSLIDEGNSLSYMPQLCVIGNDILYLYEKTTKINSDRVGCEFGVNKLDRNKYSELSGDYFEVNLNDNKNIDNGLISGELLSSSTKYAYITQKNGSAILNTFDIAANKNKSLTIADKIYNIALLNDSVLMSLQDRATNKVKLMIPSLVDDKVISRTNGAAYYRMQSDGYNAVLAIDDSFKIYILGVKDNMIIKQEVLIDTHPKEPVLFTPISKNKFLVHYSNEDDYSKNDSYILTIDSNEK